MLKYTAGGPDGIPRCSSGQLTANHHHGSGDGRRFQGGDGSLEEKLAQIRTSSYVLQAKYVFNHAGREC